MEKMKMVEKGLKIKMSLIIRILIDEGEGDEDGGEDALISVVLRIDERDEFVSLSRDSSEFND